MNRIRHRIGIYETPWGKYVLYIGYKSFNFSNI